MIVVVVFMGAVYVSARRASTEDASTEAQGQTSR
jgi:hypothetical protein